MAEQESAGVQTVAGAVDQLGATRTLLAAAKMHLFKSSLTPTPETSEADFVAAEVDSAGYAAITITWSAVGLGSDNVARIVGSRSFFQATDGITPSTVGGWWIESAAGPPGIVEAYGVLANLVALDRALAFCAVTPVIGSDGVITADVES